MISMAYDPRRETIRFVSRKIPFAFAALGLADARNGKGSVASRRPGRSGASDRGRLGSGGGKSCAKELLSP
jgi:hypothetical protein